MIFRAVEAIFIDTRDYMRDYNERGLLESALRNLIEKLQTKEDIKIKKEVTNKRYNETNMRKYNEKLQ